MNIGVVGQPGSGRRTLLRALSGSSTLPELLTLKVPDPRLDSLAADAGAKKVTPANIVLAMAFASDADSDQRVGRSLQEMDAALIVLDGFSGRDPVSDLRDMLDTWLLTDQMVIERRLERLQKEVSSGRTEGERELKALKLCLPHLEEGHPLRTLTMDESEWAAVSGFGFTSRKHGVVVLNVGDDQVASAVPDELVTLAGDAGFSVMSCAANLEEEIAQLDPDEQAAFLDDLGLESSARDRLIQAMYSVLDQVTFYTAGEKETRAWPVTAQSSAWEAAGKIHSDIQRGFIRAEIISYADYETAGSQRAAKPSMRLEGKEYAIQDGDLVYFRFNV